MCAEIRKKLYELTVNPYEDDESTGKKKVSSNGIDLTTAWRHVFRLIMTAIEELDTPLNHKMAPASD